MNVVAWRDACLELQSAARRTLGLLETEPPTIARAVALGWVGAIVQLAETLAACGEPVDVTEFNNVGEKRDGEENNVG